MKQLEVGDFIKKQEHKREEYVKGLAVKKFKRFHRNDLSKIIGVMQ